MEFGTQYIIQTDEFYYKENQKEVEKQYQTKSSRNLAHEISKYYPPTAVAFREPNQQVWEQRVVILTTEQYRKIVSLAIRMQDSRLRDLLEEIDKEEKENAI